MSGKELDRFARAFLSACQIRFRLNFRDRVLSVFRKGLIFIEELMIFQIFICKRGVFAEQSTKSHTIFCTAILSIISENCKWRK